MTHQEHRLKLYLDHRAALIDYATPIVGCRSRAEDVVQEAYLRFAALADHEPIGHPIGYLYRIVRNLAIDWSRRLASEGRRNAGEPAVDMAPTPLTPEREALHREELRVIAAALSELPERTRIAFEMHRLGGYKLQEIADSLGISVTLAHQLVRKALQHCIMRLNAVDG